MRVDFVANGKVFRLERHYYEDGLFAENVKTQQARNDKNGSRSLIHRSAIYV
jgi:hypothetical protein